MTARARIALAWALGALLVALAISGAPGLSRGEATDLDGGARAVALLAGAPRDPQGAIRGFTELSTARRGPLLGVALDGLAAVAGERLGLGPLRAGRLGAATVAAALSALLALAAFDLGGPVVAGLAPAVLWCSPRAAAAAIEDLPSLLAALLWLAAFRAFARSLTAPAPLSRVRAGFRAGAFAAAGAAVRTDLVWLPALFALRWGAGRPRRAPLALATALLFAPACWIAATPWTWIDPVRRIPAALGAGLEGGGLAPLPLALLALPVPAIALALLGLGHAALRLAGALRDRADADAGLELLLLAGAGGPLLLAAARLTSPLPGIAPVLPALPPLALLGARALAALATTAWPARARGLTGALALLLLYPGLREAARTFPLGTSAYGEAIGGTPGAAAVGLPRQEGGEAAAALLPDLSLHAVPGARIAWLGVAPGAVERERRAGRLRADLRLAATPAEADLVVVARIGDAVAPAGLGDAELAAWDALGTTRPVDALYLDEVPLALVYARPGAWR